MNLNKTASVIATSCFIASVVAQVGPPVLRCCEYTHDLSTPLPWEGEPCTDDSTVVQSCEKGSVGATAPNGKVEQNRDRPAVCKIFNIGPAGSWTNIPCGSEPSDLDAQFVGRLADGSCCWASNPTGILVINETESEQVKVRDCTPECDEVLG